MLRFTIRQLEYFVAVGDCGSVTLAAERVNVSAPSVSSAISQLEAELGLPLFVRRHAQGLSLTTAGKALFAQAQVVLREADKMLHIAGDISGEMRGPLTVGGMVSFAQVVLPAMRRAYEAVAPEVKFSQIELDQNGIFSALRRAEIDIAVSYDLGIPPDMDFIPLIGMPAYVMVAGDSPLASRTSVAPEELVWLPMVLLDLPYSAEYFLSFFGHLAERPTIVERTRDIAVLRSLVGHDFGFGLVNMRPLNDLSPDGKPLAFVPLETDLPTLQMGLSMMKGADSTQVVKHFVNFAKEWTTEGRMPRVMPEKK
ncbi:LysR family transcriptional regulator [Marivivens aquimaris]|uniref:LysR family transcriptional regulator n=1 Tax=Marivivens aquimaris TaxID=2774876 RepID=UPI0018809AD0|nr:LysR family transcriptional regulator [Marivivens aquimaris]